MLFDTDCTLYTFDGELVSAINAVMPDPYHRFDSEIISDSVLCYTYTWLDPIKVREKIIARDQRKIVFHIFVNSKKVCIFGSSESHICYALTKLQELLKINLHKVNLFDIWLRLFRGQVEWVADLIGIYLYSYGDSEVIKKISIKNTDRNEIMNYLDGDNAISCIFRTSSGSQANFYLDEASVISFAENMTLAEVNNVVQILQENC